MRGLSLKLTLGVLALVLTGACAGRPRSRPVTWAPMAAAPGQPPAVDQGDLLLQGKPVQSQSTYTAPVLITCRVELEQATGDDVGFSLLLIPEEGEPIAVRIPWGSRLFPLQAGQQYSLRFRIAPKGLVTVNDLPVPDVRVLVPEGAFRLGLVGEPVESRWRLRSIVIE